MWISSFRLRDLLSVIPEDWVLRDGDGHTVTRDELRRGALQQWDIIEKTIAVRIGLISFLVWQSYQSEWRRKSQSLHEDTRIRVTALIPVRKRHSLKFNYSDGDHATYEGNFPDVSVAWQYSRLGRPNYRS
jgi:hypothetical protein